MTTKKLDSETRIKLLEIATQLACASVGKASQGVVSDINETFEKCHESVIKRFNAESEQENS